MQQAPWDLVVVGAANTDYLVWGGPLPTAGTYHQAQQFLQISGGKGVNQAVMAARLGARVAWVGCVGADERGDAICADVQTAGVNIDYVKRTPNAATGVALIMVDQAGHSQSQAVPGANHLLEQADLEAAALLFKQTSHILVQGALTQACIQAVIERGHAAQAKVSWDPAPAYALPQATLAQLTCITPNAYEATQLTGIDVHDRHSARAAAQQLLEWGVQCVTIQAGAEGDLVVWNDGEHWLPYFVVQRVDPTGAGDAFAATFTVLRAEGATYAAAGNYASAASALVVQTVGGYPALPQRQTIEQFLKEHRT